MANIRIEERKRGAPWMLIMLMLVAAAAIGWWLWSSRSVGEPTTDSPGGVVVDSASPRDTGYTAPGAP